MPRCITFVCHYCLLNCHRLRDGGIARERNANAAEEQIQRLKPESELRRAARPERPARLERHRAPSTRAANR